MIDYHPEATGRTAAINKRRFTPFIKFYRLIMHIMFGELQDGKA